MANHTDIVIIDNTNTRAREYMWYVNLASASGLRVHVIQWTCMDVQDSCDLRDRKEDGPNDQVIEARFNLYDQSAFRQYIEEGRSRRIGLVVVSPREGTDENDAIPEWNAEDF